MDTAGEVEVKSSGEADDNVSLVPWMVPALMRGVLRVEQSMLEEALMVPQLMVWVKLDDPEMYKLGALRGT